METLLWLIHWLCLAVGATILFLFGIFCLISAVFFIAVNHSTVVCEGKTYISRFAGLRTVKWFDSDDAKDLKEYGVLVIGKERLVLQRRLHMISEHFPSFEISHRDFREGSELVISFFSGEKILLRKRHRGSRWNGTELSLSKFQETHYADLVRRATEMQSELDKKFKPIIAEASRK